MRAKIWVAALCALALAGPVWAQEGEEELNASPDAIGLEMIAEAGADGVFESYPMEHMIGVRHTGSGLLCIFDPNERARLILFPTFARGEDVGCDSGNDIEVRTLYATRYPQPTTTNEQLQGAVAAIRMRLRDARAYEPSAPVDLPPESAPLPQHSTARFTFTAENGARWYTRVSVAVVNGWTIKMRYSAQAQDDAALQQVDVSSTLLWHSILAEIVTHSSI